MRARAKFIQYLSPVAISFVRYRHERDLSAPVAVVPSGIIVYVQVYVRHLFGHSVVGSSQYYTREERRTARSRSLGRRRTGTGYTTHLPSPLRPLEVKFVYFSIFSRATPRMSFHTSFPFSKYKRPTEDSQRELKFSFSSQASQDRYGSQTSSDSFPTPTHSYQG